MLLFVFLTCKYALDDRFCGFFFTTGIDSEGRREGGFCSNYCHWETGHQQNTEHFTMPMIKQIHFPPSKSNKVNITSLSDYVLEFVTDFSARIHLLSPDHWRLQFFLLLTTDGKLDYFYWLEFKNYSPKTFIWVIDSNSYLPSDCQREQRWENTDEESWLTSHLNDSSFEQFPHDLHIVTAPNLVPGPDRLLTTSQPRIPNGIVEEVFERNLLSFEEASKLITVNWIQDEKKSKQWKVTQGRALPPATLSADKKDRNEK